MKKSTFEAKEMLCLLKFILFTNQKQPLKCALKQTCDQILYILSNRGSSFITLQAGGTNKQLKWNLSGIFQGFDKCTKATKATPLDDCFCFETWSRYHYNKKRQKFKTILIQRSSRKMNRNKNLLILYYLWKISTFSTLFHSKL